MQFSMKDIYGERYQICRKLRIGAQFTKEIHMIYFFCRKSDENSEIPGWPLQTTKPDRIIRI